MSTLLKDDLDMETQIRRKNLRTAFWNWAELTPEDFSKLVAACRLEWGEGWLAEVLQ